MLSAGAAATATLQARTTASGLVAGSTVRLPVFIGTGPLVEWPDCLARVL
jgi:hypothetical protein